MINHCKVGNILFGTFFDYSEIAYPDCVWGTFFMFPKNLLHIFPDELLPETFWMYVEDMQWCWLTRHAGYEVAFVPDGKVLHFGGSNHSPISEKMITDNFTKFLKLNYGNIHSWLIIKLLKVLKWSQWRRWYRQK